MKLLRQSTQATILFGPALDPDDAKTLVTGLSSALDHVSTGIRLSKNGAASALRNMPGSPTQVTAATVYDTFGMYRVTLDATDTDTLGRLRAMWHDEANGSPTSPRCQPIWEDFMVVPANVYDALVSGSDSLKVDAIALNSSTEAAARAARVANSVVTGTVGGGSPAPSVTNVPTSSLSPAAIDPDQFKGKILTFDKDTTSTSLRGESTEITASTPGGELTVVALTQAPVEGDTFTIT